MRRSAINPKALQPMALYAGFEGGTIYTAEKDELFYAILDERTMRDLLSEEDLEGFELVKVLEFDTAEERSAYLASRYPRRKAA